VLGASQPVLSTCFGHAPSCSCFGDVPSTKIDRGSGASHRHGHAVSKTGIQIPRSRPRRRRPVRPRTNDWDIQPRRTLSPNPSESRGSVPWKEHERCVWCPRNLHPRNLHLVSPELASPELAQRAGAENLSSSPSSASWASRYASCVNCASWATRPTGRRRRRCR
jgi:hypothetical protein